MINDILETRREVLRRGLMERQGMIASVEAQLAQLRQEQEQSIGRLQEVEKWLEEIPAQPVPPPGAVRPSVLSEQPDRPSKR